MDYPLPEDLNSLEFQELSKDQLTQLIKNLVVTNIEKDKTIALLKKKEKISTQSYSDTPEKSTTSKQKFEEAKALLESYHFPKALVEEFDNNLNGKAVKELMKALNVENIEPIDDISPLDGGTEDDVQKVFNSYANKYLGKKYYKSTSKSAKGTPFAPSMANDHKHYASNNRPDGISLVAPIFIELKKNKCSKAGKDNNASDFDALKQCLERIGMLMQRVGYLKRMVGFSAFGGQSDTSWLVYVELDESKRTSPLYRVMVSKISFEKVIPLWKKCHDHLFYEDPEFFTSRHSFTLSRTVQSYYSTNLPLEYFCVKWLATSSSGTVFLVSPPSRKLDTSGNPTTAMMWDRRSKDRVVVKVQYGDHGKTEIDCLSSISKLFGSKFYALGFWSVDDDAYKPFESTNRNPSIDVNVISSVWESKAKWDQGNCSGCGIVMHHGTSIEELDFPQDTIEKGAEEFLEILHKNEFLHRDIRIPNIMYFGEDKGIQLIDYGFSMGPSCTNSSQFDKKVPSGIQDLFTTSNDIYVYDEKSFLQEAKNWTKELDKTMLRLSLNLLTI